MIKTVAIKTNDFFIKSLKKLNLDQKKLIYLAILLHLFKLF